MDVSSRKIAAGAASLAQRPVVASDLTFRYSYTPMRLLAAACVLVGTASTAAGQTAADRSRVVPVYWVPADESVPRGHVALTIRAVEDVRAWYAHALRGRTFRYDPVIVQRSRHTFAELADSNFQQWWPLGQREFADYGLNWRDDDTKLLLVTRAAGAWAGSDSENGGIDSVADAGRVAKGSLGGFAVIGDSSLTGYLAGVCPDSGREGGTAWWCSWATFRGTVAHELAHTWGLPHPDALIPGFRCGERGKTVVQCHWDYLADTLLTYEQVHLRSLDYFDGHAGTQYRLLTDFEPYAGIGFRQAVFERDSTLTWVPGRGNGTGYPWAVVLRPPLGAAMVQYRVAGAAGFAADVGLAEGAEGRYRVRVVGEGGWVLHERILEPATAAPERLVVDLTGQRAFMLVVWPVDEPRAAVVFGNPRVYIR